MLVVGGLWWFQKKSLPVVFAEGAVHALASEASDLFVKNPATTNDEKARMIKSQHEASNINLKIDSNGKAVDPFGPVFRVENLISANKSITTITSAGPDREFGTMTSVAPTNAKGNPNKRMKNNPRESETRRGVARWLVIR